MRGALRQMNRRDIAINWIGWGSTLLLFFLIIASAVVRLLHHQTDDFWIALYCLASFTFAQFGLMPLLHLANPPLSRAAISAVSFISLYLGSYLGFYSSPVYDKVIHFVLGCVLVFIGILMGLATLKRLRNNSHSFQARWLQPFLRCPDQPAAKS